MTAQLTRAKSIAKAAEHHLRAKADRTTEYVLREHSEAVAQCHRLLSTFVVGAEMKNWGEA
jgi:hypothetical protein